MLRAIGVALFLGALQCAAHADPVADFYQGRQVQVIVGYGPGGGYDVYARLIARFIGNYIPGKPNVVVQNMPGAASLTAANYLYVTAPRDGTVIATFDRGLPQMAVLGGNSNVRFDPSKFTWIGSAASYGDDSFLLFARKDAAVQSIAEARGPNAKKLLVGVTADGATDKDVAVIVRDVLGVNLGIVAGYPDGNSISLAVERGEVDARFTGLSAANSTLPRWVSPTGPMRALLQFARETRHAQFPDAPTARELASDEKSRALVELGEAPYQLSRPFAAPPDVPKERAAALRRAFEQVTRDPGYLAEAARLKLDTTAITGDEVRALIARLGTFPPTVREEMKALQSRALSK
jgi:tripartite-type tricarboxylate transporter receptor subunit TctC